jgi:hypothetical protein
MARGCAAALACGNTLVMKPSSVACASVLHFGKLVQEAGFPDGVVNIVTGSGTEVGAGLSRHPGVRKLVFTGGTAGGREVLRDAAENITPALVEAAAARGIHHLDAPVSGGYREAENGTLVIIVGASATRSSGRSRCWTSSAPPCTTRALGGGEHRQARQQRDVDGQHAGRRRGVRARGQGGHGPEDAFEILRTSAGRSYHFERRLPNILARNFAPGFTVDLARKDLGLAVDMARSRDVPAPATSLLHQLYNASSALGDGPNDFAAIVKLFESWAGTEVRGA